MIYVVDPSLTGAECTEAQSFVEACLAALTRRVAVTALRTREATASASLTTDDLVVVMNGDSAKTPPEVARLLERAARGIDSVLPVAINPAVRSPHSAISGTQSFDVAEALRARGLATAQVAVVAEAVARMLVARVQPTLCKERMRLFVSYRRFDGEELAFAFWEQAVRRWEAAGVFRDLRDIRAGEDNDEKILAALANSDAVVFLDTPKSGESWWIARELELALSRNLPIVWIRFGREDGRVPLRVEPAGQPHLRFPVLDAATDAVSSELVDRVLQTAFDLSRASCLRVFDAIRRLEAIAQTGTARVRQLDGKRMVYDVRVPRSGGRYPERPLTHVVQFFGRWPSADDHGGFREALTAAGYDAHPQHGAPYDAAVLLGPIPRQEATDGGHGHIHLDSADEYVTSLEHRLRPGRTNARRGVILSGAFPDVAPEHQRHVTEAVYAFARALFDRDASVIFGGHPTFTPMIFEIAQQTRPDDVRAATRLYLSRFFVAPADIERYRTDAELTLTPVVGDDRGASLTAMRRAMITDAEAVGLVAIGGREPSPGRTPGVDEEIALARSVGLPVFLVGAAGGRAATLAAAYREGGWPPALNPLSPDENDALFVGTDFGVLANLVLDRLGL